MKKIILALIVACLLIGAVGVVALSAPAQVASHSSSPLAKENGPTIALPPIQSLAQPPVAWNS